MTRLAVLLRRHPIAHVPRLRVSPHPHMEDAAAGTGKRYEDARDLFNGMAWLWLVVAAVSIVIVLGNLLAGL